MASSESKGFAPKTPVTLDPPKDDPISVEDLSKCDGTAAHLLLHIPTVFLSWISELITRQGNSSSYPTYVAIKGTVFDVSGNSAYGPNGSYHGTSDASAPSPLTLATPNPRNQASLGRPKPSVAFSPTNPDSSPPFPVQATTAKPI